MFVMLLRERLLTSECFCQFFFLFFFSSSMGMVAVLSFKYLVPLSVTQGLTLVSHS